MRDVTFKVQGVGETPSRIKVSARQFSLVLDEPAALGGTDAGPNPVETLLAALLGCLNVLGHQVAREMGFAIHRLAMEAEGVLNPARLMGRPSGERAGFQSVRVTLRVKADADEAVLARWAEQIEQRCPVSDTIGNATPVAVHVQHEG